MRLQAQKIRCVVLAYSIFFSCIDLENRPAQAIQLNGGVEVEEKLDALPSELKKGVPLKTQPLLPQAAGDWFTIPDWLAGTWQSVQILQLSTLNQKTSEETEMGKTIPVIEREKFGLQLDNKSGIWTAGRSYGFVKSANEQTWKSFRTNTLVGKSADSMTFRTDDLGFQLDDKSQIKMLSRQQSIRTFRLLDDKTIVAMCTVRVYDSAGLSVSTSKVVCIFRKAEDFSPTDVSDDHDLRGSFSKFLQRTGHGNLLATPARE